MERMQLELCGVREMDQNEMKAENGGLSMRAAGAAFGLKTYALYFMWEVISNPQAHIDAFKAGWDAAGE